MLFPVHVYQGDDAIHTDHQNVTTNTLKADVLVWRRNEKHVKIPT